MQPLCCAYIWLAAAQWRNKCVWWIAAAIAYGSIVLCSAGRGRCFHGSIYPALCLE
jgi:hypothetical protein